MSGGPVFVVWVSALEPALEHAVTDEETAERNATGRGVYRAVCGMDFLPAPDDQPALHRCPACLGLVRPRTAAPASPQSCGGRRGRRGRHARRRCSRRVVVR